MPNPYDDLIDNEETMNNKPIVKSRTFWVNVLTAAVGVLTTLGGSELIQDNPQVAGIFVTIIGIANVLLRVVTKTAVTMK